MYDLEEVRLSIQRLTNGVAHALRAEVAVFDSQARLFYGTPTYVKKKGRIVHVPSIDEVLRYGSVLVNTPGEMSSCSGCRFKDNCPSTIEILSCIKAEGMVVGVVGLTSFAKEGHARMSSHTQVYLDAVTELASLIGDIVFSHSGARPIISLNEFVGSALEISSDPLLIADAHGVITQYNSAAMKALDFCCLSAASLWHVLPHDDVKRLLGGAELHDEAVLVGEWQAHLSSRCIVSDKKISAVVVKLSNLSYRQALETEQMKKIVGVGAEAKRIHFLVKKLADSPTPVLITGETGTGKELVARAIHAQSQRRKGPFIAINCSGVPESLFESELFGYEEGSFTGAKKGGKKGKFEMAQGGTLFLDELGEMPLSLQPKLLRVLQDYKIERVGSAEKIALDIRILAATNCNLQEMLEAGSFREDLFYRIGVIDIDLPPLRKRRSDIMPIALDYLQRIKARISTPVTSFSPEVEDLFLRYSWRGNVRELQNVVEYVANLCDCEEVGLEDLPPRLVEFHTHTEKPARLERTDEQQIRQLLEQYGYTLEGKNHIARELGISLRTLYRKLEKMNLS